MPQEFHVLQCHKCKTFQVQQVKKVLKWNCKLCGEKQSVLRVYGRGSGADCRKHVQNLNKLRGEIEANQEEKIVTAKCVEEADTYLQNFQIDPSEVEVNIHGSNSSKWDKYVEPLVKEDDKDGREDDSSYTTDRSQYNMVNRQYRKLKRDNYKQNQPYHKYTNKMDANSRWNSDSYNKTARNTVNEFSDFGKTSDLRIKRLPETCLVSNTAKKTKRDNFVGFNQEKLPTSSDMNSDFNSVDSFLEDKFEVPNCNTSISSNTMIMACGSSKITACAQAENIPVDISKTKFANAVPQKKSKWDAFISTSPEHDSEYYIPPDDDSVDFEFNSDPGPNYKYGNEQGFNYDSFDKVSPSQSQNEVDSQVNKLNAPNVIKSDSEKVTFVSRSELITLKSDFKSTSERVSTSNSKTISKEKMFQVNDFDETELEFVI